MLMKTFYPSRFLVGVICLTMLLQSCGKEENGYRKVYEKAVLPAPRFKITMIENCQPPYRVHFENLTTDTLGDDTYFWDYGNGVTSNSIAPIVAGYDAADTFKLSLRVSNVVGSSVFDTTILLPESQEIVSDFSFESEYGSNFWEPCPVKFTNLSQHAKSYTWEFGDDETSIQENPLHIFREKGTYSVTLFSECGGMEASSFKTITIDGPPRNFTLEEIHLNFLPEKFMNDVDTLDGTFGIDIFYEAFLGGQNILSGSTIRGVSGARDYPISWESDDRIAIDSYAEPLLIRFFDDDFDGNPQFIATMTIPMTTLQDEFYPDEFTKYDEDDLEVKIVVKWK